MGSTSVSGLAAEPIIDIVIVVPDVEGVAADVSDLERLGYAPQANRVFRAYLAANPEAARRYERAKRAAAQANPDSRARYGEAKAAVFFDLLKQSRLWSAR